ncbi:MAG: RND transporter, partial [Cyclobacteriaceae bacterium]|nr:RND transporter [Cyclobacteriaceae bacterium]
MKKRNYIIAAAGALVLVVAFFVVSGSQDGTASDILSVVKRGQFRVEIETTGELEAKNSVKIMGPQQLRNFQIWQVTIQNIVDEGTVV